MKALEKSWPMSNQSQPGKKAKNDRLLFLLGLCRKASAVSSGEELCEAAVKSGKAFLVLVSVDASANTNKKFHDKCAFYHVPIQTAPYGKERLGKAMGTSPRSCMAITNEGLANLINEALKTCIEEVENIG